MKILVAYDGSSYSDKALDRALEAAKKFAAELTVLLAVPPLCIADLEMPGETCQRLEEALDKEAKKTMAPVADRLRKESVAAKTLIQTGDPAELILDVADSARRTSSSWGTGAATGPSGCCSARFPARFRSTPSATCGS